MKCKTFLNLLAIITFIFSCGTHMLSLTGSFSSNDHKALDNWIASWQRQTRKQLFNGSNDTLKTVQSCYRFFMQPEISGAYENRSSFYSLRDWKDKKHKFRIIQGTLSYLILPDTALLPDTSSLYKGSILDHCNKLIRVVQPETLRKGEFLSAKDTPHNWLLLDSSHQQEITAFLGETSMGDSIAERKRLFLKPYFRIYWTGHLGTPLHKRESWAAETQPEVILIAVDSSMSTAQIFFMIEEMKIGFAILKREQQDWHMIYTKLDDWDRID